MTAMLCLTAWCVLSIPLGLLLARAMRRLS